MKCPVCSHVYPDTQSRCSRCGRVAPEASTTQPGSKSTLIEFPSTRPRAALPDWRVELNEKVRAIKARRSMEALVDEAASLRQASLLPRTPVAAPPPPVPAPEPEPTNPIVAAALDRVRRASENAARVARQPAFATAAAAAPSPVVEPSPVRDVPPPRIVPAPVPAFAPPVALASAPTRTLPAQRELFDPAELLDGLDDELDVLDYDEAPPLALGAAPLHSRASLALRGVAALVDLALFCVVSVPFVATTYAIDGDFSRPSVVVLLASTLLLLGVFYLFTMFAMCGRTVGMMFSRTHVVGLDGGPPSSRSVLLRVLGSILSIAPAGLGFAWALFNGERCGWHDLVSGTRVVED